MKEALRNLQISENRKSVKCLMKGCGFMRKIILIVFILLSLFGCTPSIEERIEDVSLAFGERLHENSLMNPLWFDEVNARLDALSKNAESDNGQLGSYDVNEVYPEYIEHIEEDYANLCTEKGLEEVKLHLMYNRFHEEEEKVEFVKVTEHENSYESVIDVISSHYVLRIYLTFMKSEKDPKVNGFKVKPLEFSNPE